MTIDEYKKTTHKLTPAVVGYLVKDNKVILGLRKNSSIGLGLNIVAGIGGKVGDTEDLKNETNEEALAREVFEEIGVRIKKFEKMGKVVFYFPAKEKWNQAVEIYKVTDWEGEMKETESTKPAVYDINNLPKEQMWDDNLYWVPLVLAGKKIDADFMYDEKNEKVCEKRINISTN